MTILHRMAGPGDAALLADLGRRSFIETFGHLYDPSNLALFLENHKQEKWRSELADPAFAVRVVEADGEAAGYAKLGPLSFPLEPQGNPLELRQFYVLKPWHGTSVARELMEWVLEEARKRGADELYLSVFIDNHRARRFYERYGFRFVRTFAFMVGTHADEDHILRLDLKER
jgi:GNAT superfamily N-acetyltransferase